MQNVYIFVLIISISLQAVATGEIKGGSLKFASYNELERLEALEKENQHLLGRIEVAEHNIAKLEKSLRSLQQEALTLTDATVAKTFKGDPLSDIFDIEADKHPRIQLNSVTNNAGDNIAKDKQFYDLALASFKENKFSRSRKKICRIFKRFSY